MNKKFLSAILFGALMVTSTGTFVSCKDYDDDIDEINSKIDKIETTLSELESKIGDKGVTSVTFDEKTGVLTVVDGTGTKTYTIKTTAPDVDELTITIEGKDLKVDGKVIGQVGDTVAVKNGELTINGTATGIKVGQYAILDNQSAGTVTITLPDANGKLQTVELMKASAALTSVQFQNTPTFIDIVGTNNAIQWGTAHIAFPNWGGKKGTITRNQLMVGQTNVVNVQVTPASYDLGAQTLTLVDSKGNVAPVNVTAVANNRLISRAASANGNWALSIEMTDDVTANNIKEVFDFDAIHPMAYTLCVNGIPYTTYELAVVPSNNKSTVSAPITTVRGGDVKYVTADGRVATLNTGKFPTGSTELFIEQCNLYDSYITFEGTNKSLAEQYGITVDGMTINVPASATGVTIKGIVHTMAINGYESAITDNEVEFNIIGSTVTAQTIAATTHQIAPAATAADVLKNVRIDLGDVFKNIPAATREAARETAQFYVVEEKSQTGFLVKHNIALANSTYNKFNTVSYLKADGTTWTDNTDDILDLRYIELPVYQAVAADAQPGDYQLSFVVMDENYVTGSGNIKGNEIIKINMPVNVTVPSFADMFEKTATEWNTAKTEFNARIYVEPTNDAQLRFGEAFNKTANYADAEYSQVVYDVKYIDSKSPIATSSNVELSTENGIARINGRGGLAILNKTVVYNATGDALKENTFANMTAYYPLFYQVTKTDANRFLTHDEFDALQEAFTVASDSYTSKLVTPLAGVAISTGDIVLNAAGEAALSLKLGTSTVVVNNTNIARGATAALTNSNGASYTLNTAAPSGNVVKAEFTIESGATVALTATGIKVTGLTGMSTLKVTLTDATGIVYTSTVQIQPAK
ncbi:hypothetical protein [uncultured Phocaeicola sp.]|uniref:hypothetical protein n=1 Tax=uncultured Phocaeicola sp. TaxID=990718 RepID=UPI0025A66262|nr:hypothetical protein [uncultured Phocaeicola sp.]